MTFSSDTHIEECLDANDSVPTVQYNFVPIAQLANLEPQTVVGKFLKFIPQKTQISAILFIFIDCIGVCREAGELFQFTAKTSGKELKKKDITLVDSSNAAVSIKQILL